MYQPYPSGGQVPEPQRPEPPAPVLTAVKLMYAGAVVSAISLVATLLTIGSLKTAIHNSDPSLTQTQLHSAETAAVAVAVIVGVIGIGLWIWMARANQAGKNWARITATVFFGLDTLGLLVSIRQAEPLLSRLISILTFLIGLAAIILLWRKESSEYFAAPRQP
jgi:cytochrome bd-type quinol oxidase subunit 2